MHLDVKPRNLFLVGDHVKVADFGLAKHLERQSSSGIMAGISPQYAAPETFTSRITKHTDQYSLAIVYMELLTGKRPFTGKTIRELALQHMNVEPDLTALPERDRRAVGRALAKDPFKRFPNCKAFIEACSRRRGSSEEISPRRDSADPADREVGRKSTNTTRLPRPVKLDLDSCPARLCASRRLSCRASAITGLDWPDGPGVAVRRGRVPDRMTPEPADSQRVSFDFPEADGGVLRPTLIIGVGRVRPAGIARATQPADRPRRRPAAGPGDAVPVPRRRPRGADDRRRGFAGPGAAAGTGVPDPAAAGRPVSAGGPRPLERMAAAGEAARDPAEHAPAGFAGAGPAGVHRELPAFRHPRSPGAGDRGPPGVADAVGRPRRPAARATRGRESSSLAAAGGGSSGALPDIGYAVTKLLDPVEAADAGDGVSLPGRAGRSDHAARRSAPTSMPR